MSDPTPTPSYDPASGVDPTPEQAAQLGIAESALLDSLRPGWDERVQQVERYRHEREKREAREAVEAKQAEFEQRLETDPHFRVEYQREIAARQLKEGYWHLSKHERLQRAASAGSRLNLDERQTADLMELSDRLRPAPSHYVQDNDLAVFELYGKKVILAS